MVPVPRDKEENMTAGDGLYSLEEWMAAPRGAGGGRERGLNV